MIVGSLENVSIQVRQHANISAALVYLEQMCPAEIEDGRHTVAAPDIYAIFQTYKTIQPSETIEVEGHRKFIDIYLMLEGSEQVGWVSTEQLGDLPVYDAVGDVWKKSIEKGQLSFVSLHEGDAAILFPEDAHAAQFILDDTGHARKVVMKVAV